MKKIILMLAFCGSLVAMSAQVNEPDRSIYSTGTEQEDKSKLQSMPSEKSTMTQDNNNQCTPGTAKHKGDHKMKYSSNEPNGTTGSQNDFMSGAGKPIDQGDHMKTAKSSHKGHMKMAKSTMKSEGKTGLTTVTYTQTPIPEDHTAVSVPEKVRNAFSNAYLNAKATWKREGENYRALFKSSDKDALETIVVYDKNGKEIVVEKELKSDACPTTIAKFCAKNERIWEIFEKGMPMKYFIQEKGERNKWFDKDGNRIYGATESHGVAHTTRPYSK